MKPYFTDPTVTLYHATALDALRALPDASVASIVTSPPYYGLRAYGDDDREHGREATVADFVTGLRDVMREARRVLEPTGTLWVNLGDSYSSRANARTTYTGNRAKGHGNIAGIVPAQRNTIADAPFKSLLMVPERFALAMLEDRWVLRNKITWSKPNGAPERVTDRFTQKCELIYLFTPGPRYWFNLDPLRVPHRMRPQRRLTPKKDKVARGAGQPTQTWSNWTRDEPGVDGHPLGANPGDHWTLADDDHDAAAALDSTWNVSTEPFPGAHYAVMPSEVARRCIVAGARPGGTVLDPFHGSGTTGMVAERHGHPYIGVDLYSDNLDLSLRTRIASGVLPVGGPQRHHQGAHS